MTGPRRLGAEITLPAGPRVDERLFGEAPSRVVVSVPPSEAPRFARIVGEWAIPVSTLGRVGGHQLSIRIGETVRVSLPVATLAEAFENGLPRSLAEAV